MTFHGNSRTVLAVDLDYFFAQCEQLRRADIKDKPVVVCVYSGRSKDSGVVSTCNYIARNFGVRSGIPITQAKKILSGNQAAVFLPIDREYYESISERIMAILRTHSTLWEQVSIDEAYLDLTPEANGDLDLAKEIGYKIKIEILEKENLTCSVGIGPNKLIAKMAADSVKPNGLTIVSSEMVRPFLDPMPVAKLVGIGPRTEQKLNELNIKRIGDLARHDENALIAEFGNNLGPHLKHFAMGIDEDPVQQRTTGQFSRIVTLKRNTSSLAFEVELNSLCKDISQKLETRGLRCKSVGIIAISSDLRTKNRSKTLDAPIFTAEEIEETAKGLFRSFFEEGETLVRRIGVKVSEFTTFERFKNDSVLTDFLA